MAIAYTAERYAARTLVNDNKSVIAPTATIAAGSTAILFCGQGTTTATVTTITDSKGNTWTVNHQYSGGNVKNIAVASAPITAAILTSDTITINYSAAANLNREHYIIEVAGLAAASIFDKFADNTGASGTSITTAATATLSQADEIVFQFTENSSAGAITVGGGWTQSTTKDVVTAHLQYQIVAATTGIAGAMTQTNAAWDTMVVTYKGAAAAVKPKTLQILGVG